MSCVPHTTTSRPEGCALETLKGRECINWCLIKSLWSGGVCSKGVQETQVGARGPVDAICCECSLQQAHKASLLGRQVTSSPHQKNKNTSFSAALLIAIRRPYYLIITLRQDALSHLLSCSGNRLVVTRVGILNPLPRAAYGQGPEHFKQSQYGSALACRLVPNAWSRLSVGRWQAFGQQSCKSRSRAGPCYEFRPGTGVSQSRTFAFEHDLSPRRKFFAHLCHSLQ